MRTEQYLITTISLLVMFYFVLVLQNAIASESMNCHALGSIVNIDDSRIVTLDDGLQYTLSGLKLLRTGMEIEECTYSSWMYPNITIVR